MEHGFVRVWRNDGVEGVEAHFGPGGRKNAAYNLTIRSWKWHFGCFHRSDNSSELDHKTARAVVDLIRALATWVQPYLPPEDKLTVDYRTEVPVSGFGSK